MDALMLTLSLREFLGPWWAWSYSLSVFSAQFRKGIAL
ncbi:hypothetical protein CEV31_2717 [Brucella thiophenivorans]|uniref:Uncharacterized protein n=1 Tax=Brucella thiophenivorans TaxID=571255 RepID=A0A256FN78_9HYPH|nr:hypothetical protein CEV31_2717 [Brucella thiophenivorans]